MNISPERIEEFLKKRPRNELNRPDLVHAGVLILLFHKGAELHVLLTKRSSDVEHHRGQISFPGGAVDENDADIVATAIRETEVRPSPIEVEEVLEVPLSFFLDPRNERVKQMTRSGTPMNVYFYTYGSSEVWGATASMLRSLVRALRTIRSE